MDLHSEASAPQTLQIWQSRQKADGCLVAVLLLAAVIPTLRFAFHPTPATAWVMAVFLFALGMACLRLLNSAAQVVRIRGSFKGASPDVLVAEILDVYEHPGTPIPTPAKSASAFWLPAGKDTKQSDFDQLFASSLLKTERRHCQGPKSSRW